LKLNGDFPLFSASKIAFLDLSGNALTGDLEMTAWDDLVDLIVLDVSSNRLDGSIPSSIGAIPRLQLASFYSNDISGTMPTEICSLTPSPLKNLEADCAGVDPKVPCTCCTFCSTS
jgi:protein brassinosteroid insensitive 1